MKKTKVIHRVQAHIIPRVGVTLCGLEFTELAEIQHVNPRDVDSIKNKPLCVSDDWRPVNCKTCRKYEQ